MILRDSQAERRRPWQLAQSVQQVRVKGPETLDPGDQEGRIVPVRQPQSAGVINQIMMDHHRRHRGVREQRRERRQGRLRSAPAVHAALGQGDQEAGRRVLGAHRLDVGQRPGGVVRGVGRGLADPAGVAAVFGVRIGIAVVIGGVVAGVPGRVDLVAQFKEV